MNVNRIQHCIIISLFGATLMINSSCDEVFPPYSIPQNVLSGSIHINDLDTVTVYYNKSTDYYYTNNSLTLNIDVVNTYDDLLQGDAMIGDRLTLQAFGKRPAVIVIPLTLGSLRFPSVFRGTLALSPHDTAKFRIAFLPIDKNNIPVYFGGDYVQVDSFRVYGPIEFIANADIRLFERVQSIFTGNYRFSVFFKEIITD